METLIESGLVQGVMDITATEWADELVDPAAASTFSVSATCPAGKRAIAGSAFGETNSIILSGSYASGISGESWTAYWTTDGGVTIDPSQLIVSALCAPAAL